EDFEADASANGKSDAKSDAKSGAKGSKHVASTAAKSGTPTGHVATIPKVDMQPDTGPYPKAVLRRIIKGAVNDLGDCYRNHSADDLSKHVDVDFTIGSDGKVVDAMSKKSGNDALDTCLADIFKKLVFPPPQGGGQI